MCFKHKLIYVHVFLRVRQSDHVYTVIDAIHTKLEIEHEVAPFLLNR